MGIALRPRSWAGAFWITGCVCVFFLLPRTTWSGEPPPEASTVSPPNHPIVGERLSYHGYWFGIPVGSGWLAVQEIVEVEGRRAYHIEAHGSSNELLSTFYPIQDTVHSYLDAETLQPLRFEKRQREGHYRSDEVVTFDHASRTATYRSLLNQSVKQIPLPEHFQDLISALYWLRDQPLSPPQSLPLDLYTDEKIYQIEILIDPPVTLELLKRGTFRCLMVQPSKAAFKGLLVRRGQLWAYLTADANRLPILLKVSTPWGAMSAVLDEESFPTALRHHFSITSDNIPSVK